MKGLKNNDVPNEFVVRRGEKFHQSWKCAMKKDHLGRTDTRNCAIEGLGKPEHEWLKCNLNFSFHMIHNTIETDLCVHDDQRRLV